LKEKNENVLYQSSSVGLVHQLYATLSCMVTVLIECSSSSQTNYSVVWLVANPMKHPARAWAIITWLQDISA